MKWAISFPTPDNPVYRDYLLKRSAQWQSDIDKSRQERDTPLVRINTPERLPRTTTFADETRVLHTQSGRGGKKEIRNNWLVILY